jgi:hypothetical protein
MSDERLYGLLPAVHRLRDAERGEPLRALLGLIEVELRRVEASIDELGDSWFIETCPPWLVPYIGDLVGNRPLLDTPAGGRADVARTIHYRRRKGTLPMLEELARNVTGWPAHAVEMMETLAWSQHINHVRRTLAVDVKRPFDASAAELRHPPATTRVGTVLVRDSDGMGLLDGPFDRTAHTVDVRRAPDGLTPPSRRRPRARRQEGLYGARKTGFFLWRLRPYSLDDVPARRAEAPATHGWHFRALGAAAPLFTRPRAERDPARQSTELHVPGPIRPGAFHADVEAFRRRWLPEAPVDRPLETESFYGTDRSFHIVANGDPVLPEQLLCKDLGKWARPPAGRVAVDVRRGRIAFATGEEPDTVDVSYTWGFSADIGGGPYDRRTVLPPPPPPVWHRTVAKFGALETLQQALTAWADDGRPHAVIDIADSGVYGGSIAIALPAGGSLTIRAEQGRFPSVRTVGNLVIDATEGDAGVELNGLLFEGAIELRGSPSLSLRHCTIVPGRMLDENGEPWFGDRDAIVTTDATATLSVLIDRSICGPLRIPETTRRLEVRDSILHGLTVDGTARPAIAADDAAAEPGPLTHLRRVTVFGEVHVRELHASDTLFNDAVRTRRTQAGCVRYSHVPDGSRTPRRFRCQPDLALVDVTDVAERTRIRARIMPRYTARRYGDAAYAQLHRTCAIELRTGASNNAEMGAFNLLMQPQREANLRTRLDEYLPFGLEAGLVYVT